MEEAASLCSLVLALKNECAATHPIPEEELVTYFVDAFVTTSDQNLILFLQGLLHNKPDIIELDNVPLLGDIIQQHVRKTDVQITGVPKTDLINAEIEQTEFMLFDQKLHADIEAIEVFLRRVRTLG